MLLCLQFNRQTDRADAPAIYRLNDRADTHTIYNRLTDRADVPAIYRPTDRLSSMPDPLSPFDACTVLLPDPDYCRADMPAT